MLLKINYFNKFLLNRRLREQMCMYVVSTNLKYIYVYNVYI